MTGAGTAAVAAAAAAVGLMLLLWWEAVKSKGNIREGRDENVKTLEVAGQEHGTYLPKEDGFWRHRFVLIHRWDSKDIDMHIEKKSKEKSLRLEENVSLPTV